MAKKQAKTGTVLEFIGGVNRDRIGGNCSVIAHTEKGKTTRVMYDLGTMFTPYESGFSAALPNVEDYFDRLNPETDEYTKAIKPVSALFITHAHEDHIGALIEYTKMGYRLPPIYASKFTRALIRLAFKQEGLDAPEIETVKPKQEIKIGDNMVIEPFTVSHSIIGAMGFHTLTTVRGKPHAGIVNNGDFLTEEDMPVGESFSNEDYDDLLQRKLVTHVLVDSTSTQPHGSERIGFEQAVENCLDVINRHSDRNIIISPVISRSVQNLAIDIEVARRLGAKICLDGKWLDLVRQAMELSGYGKDFEDVIYKGKLSKYLADKSIKTKYIVNTGAFAQGLKEYNLNQSDSSNFPMASATKMALGLHKDIKLDKKCLILGRQRIIEDICGAEGVEMYQKMAAQGAVIAITPGSRKVGNAEEVQMQDSGHLNEQALNKYLDKLKKYAPHVVIIPIHGNPNQLVHTAKMALKKKINVFIAINKQALSLAKEKTESLNDKVQMLWVGVKKVFHNPLNPDPTVPYQGKTEYWHIDEWYMPVDKIGEQANVLSYQKGDNAYTYNGGSLFDDKYEDMVERETMNKNRKEKHVTRQEKGDKKTRAERDAEKKVELKRRKEEKKAKEQLRAAKKSGKSILD